MKRLLLTLLPILGIIYTQTAEISNVQVAQRTDGSKIVDITYDLSPDALFTDYTITVEISFNGGDTWNQTNYVQGDVGVVEAGTEKAIEWYMGNQYSNTFNDNVQVRVLAESTIYWESQMDFEMVSVPAGDYTYGSNDELLTIDYDFEMSKYPITNAQYTEFLIEAYQTGEVWISGGDVVGFYAGDEHYSGGDYDLYNLGTPSESYNYGQISWNNTTFIVTEGFGNHPVVKVTWFGAYKFAEHYGMRLPNEHEWEKTARAETGSDYPWGDNIDGSNANYSGSGDPWDNGTTPVGFYNGQAYEGFQTTDSSSPYGAYDMAGNVWEWTQSWYSETSSGRVVRGGSWDGDTVNCQSWYRSYGIPTGNNIDIGFRVARTQ